MLFLNLIAVTAGSKQCEFLHKVIAVNLISVMIYEQQIWLRKLWNRKVCFTFIERNLHVDVSQLICFVEEFGVEMDVRRERKA